MNLSDRLSETELDGQSVKSDEKSDVGYCTTSPDEGLIEDSKRKQPVDIFLGTQTTFTFCPPVTV
jgi:hypothetical protein